MGRVLRGLTTPIRTSRMEGVFEKLIIKLFNIFFQRRREKNKFSSIMFKTKMENNTFPCNIPYYDIVQSYPSMIKSTTQTGIEHHRMVWRPTPPNHKGVHKSLRETETEFRFWLQKSLIYQVLDNKKNLFYPYVSSFFKYLLH